MKCVIISGIVMIILFSGICLAEQADEPAWIVFEKGKAELRKKEYGNALRFFKMAIQIKGTFPEAELLIGDIYRLSDNPIAIEYYQRAYELKKYFVIPDDKYTALYRIIDVCREEKNYREYSETVKKVIEEDLTYFTEQFQRYHKEFFTIFSSSHLDQLLVLHRIPDRQYVVKAHSEYGWYYYKTGMYKDSIIHSLFAVVGAISEAFRELRRYQPLYAYTTMNDFLENAFTYEDIRSYLVDDVDIFSILYYLGCAAYVEIGYTRARQVWNSVADSSYKNKYQDQARKQINNPWVEELLDIPKKIEFEWEL
jgi:tetratricopeptide (TPR) repeat protein